MVHVTFPCFTGLSRKKPPPHFYCGGGFYHVFPAVQNWIRRSVFTVIGKKCNGNGTKHCETKSNGNGSPFLPGCTMFSGALQYHRFNSVFCYAIPFHPLSPSFHTKSSWLFKEIVHVKPILNLLCYRPPKSLQAPVLSGHRQGFPWH